MANEGDDGDVSKRDLAKRSDVLDVCNFRPEIFDGCIEIPRFRLCGLICFQFFGPQGTVFGAQVVEHGTRCDIAEAKSRTFQGTEKRGIHGSEDLCSERSTEIVV